LNIEKITLSIAKNTHLNLFHQNDCLQKIIVNGDKKLNKWELDVKMRHFMILFLNSNSFYKAQISW